MISRSSLLVVFFLSSCVFGQTDFSAVESLGYKPGAKVEGEFRSLVVTASKDSQDYALIRRPKTKVFDSIKENPHPHVIKIFDIIAQPDSENCWIVMELAGKSVLGMKKEFVPSLSGVVVGDVMKGLKHLKELGIEHWDIAARNFVLGKDGLFKIIDFDSTFDFGPSAEERQIRKVGKVALQIAFDDLSPALPEVFGVPEEAQDLAEKMMGGKLRTFDEVLAHPWVVKCLAARESGVPVEGDAKVIGLLEAHPHPNVINPADITPEYRKSVVETSNLAKMMEDGKVTAEHIPQLFADLTAAFDHLHNLDWCYGYNTVRGSEVVYEDGVFKVIGYGGYEPGMNALRKNDRARVFFWTSNAIRQVRNYFDCRIRKLITGECIPGHESYEAISNEFYNVNKARSERMSLSEVLAHPWVRSHAERPAVQAAREKTEIKKREIAERLKGLTRRPFSPQRPDEARGEEKPDEEASKNLRG